jgi:hypothetical protein
MFTYSNDDDDNNNNNNSAINPSSPEKAYEVGWVLKYLMAVPVFCSSLI